MPAAGTNGSPLKNRLKPPKRKRCYSHHPFEKVLLLLVSVPGSSTPWNTPSCLAFVTMVFFGPTKSTECICKNQPVPAGCFPCFDHWRVIVQPMTIKDERVSGKCVQFGGLLRISTSLYECMVEVLKCYVLSTGHVKASINYIKQRQYRDIDSSHKAWMKWINWIVVCVLLSGTRNLDMKDFGRLRTCKCMTSTPKCNDPVHMYEVNLVQTLMRQAEFSNNLVLLLHLKNVWKMDTNQQDNKHVKIVLSPKRHSE